MNLTILLFVSLTSLALIIYGKKYGHLEMSLLGFTFLFVMGLAIAGNNVLGLEAGIDYKTGYTENITYSYDANATGQNDDIQSIYSDLQYTYNNYTSTFLGSWIAIVSFLGALGIILGETIWKRKL